MTWTVAVGDCVELMSLMGEASVDAVVTDPPYGLEFMGKEWDRPWAVGFSDTGYTDGGTRPQRPSFGSNRNPVCLTCHKHKRGTRSCRCEVPRFDETPATSSQAFGVWCETWATEALRVLKPGGHLLSFGGTRTYHRLVCALEDAGFEIRDCLAWLYGSGFPKSLDVSKAIDKAAGAAREVVGNRRTAFTGKGVGGHSRAFDRDQGYRPDGNAYPSEVNVDERGYKLIPVTAPATPDAERWQGWGTALKPAFEPIVLARKPLSGTVAQNVLEHGTGALNVDGTRIDPGSEVPGGGGFKGGATSRHDGWQRPSHAEDEAVAPHSLGRWPANVLLDADAAAALDEQSGERPSRGGRAFEKNMIYGKDNRSLESQTDRSEIGFGDSGGASRFFYTPKADRAERENGQHYGDSRNNHPTVKPVDLMQWLCRLVTPPKGLILDPFTGSGSTGIAALREGFSFIGIEREPDYVEIARARIIGDAPLFNVGIESA